MIDMEPDRCSRIAAYGLGLQSSLKGAVTQGGFLRSTIHTHEEKGADQQKCSLEARGRDAPGEWGVRETQVGIKHTASQYRDGGTQQVAGGKPHQYQQLVLQIKPACIDRGNACCPRLQQRISQPANIRSNKRTLAILEAESRRQWEG